MALPGHSVKIVSGFLLLVMIVYLSISPHMAGASQCSDKGVVLQVLGSGGPELDDGRASSAYLIWIDGRARIIVDMGSGSMLNYEHSGARISDLDLVLFTHLHVDHANDLPALIKASYFSDRSRDLPLYGPTGNHLMPGMQDYIMTLFGKQGAYRYLSDYLSGEESYRLIPLDVKEDSEQVQQVLSNSDYRISAITVHHGPIPSLAWRIDIGEHSIVISGDMSNRYESLHKLARNADLLVAHHAIPESATGAARNLHMPPSEIGKIAARANAGTVLLSHRMNRTLGQEKESEKIIKDDYPGKVIFAEDMQCISVGKR